MTDEYPLGSYWTDIHTYRVWKMTENGWLYLGISKSSSWWDIMAIDPQHN
jgi:hypothetical protein